MSNYYDDDDFEVTDNTEQHDWFELGSEEMDIYDFDDRLDAYLAELDGEIEEARSNIAKALFNGEEDAIVERLKDELALLMMDYTRFGR